MSFHVNNSLDWSSVNVVGMCGDFFLEAEAHQRTQVKGSGGTRKGLRSWGIWTTDQLG